jgi:hypothetical protein
MSDEARLTAIKERSERASLATAEEIAELKGDIEYLLDLVASHTRAVEATQATFYRDEGEGLGGARLWRCLVCGKGWQTGGMFPSGPQHHSPCPVEQLVVAARPHEQEQASGWEVTYPQSDRTEMAQLRAALTAKDQQIDYLKERVEFKRYEEAETALAEARQQLAALRQQLNELQQELLEDRGYK